MRTHRPRTPFHLLRASALSTVILTLAAGAHLAGGGALPQPVIMLAMLALTALAGTTATRLKLGFPAMAALLGGGQLVLHKVFTGFSAPPVTALPGSNLIHEGHHSGSAVLAPMVDHLYGAGAGSGPLMLAAHVTATLGSAFMLAKGEDALWALANWLRPLFALPRPLKNDGGAQPSVASPPSAAPLRPWRNLRQDSRRGPPSAVALSS
ncbi:hypothetical protein [Pseudarthrobacter sp. NamE5]|uniref:hypothetical protein n=1 Tax=Pseudarthrobacter sp. NamE5 TaxID=2576839 RepID=UPI00110B0F83|nr:hypothetical protein [Pseudarthrobacter sp. NamE5]TLM87180.1 hypothetical protein FDW84_05120 [Pseudarthrobacter sp. NamE5]